MAIKRKRITVLLTVSVPEYMSAAEARDEIRSLMTHQCNVFADPGDLKVASLKPLARARKS